MFKNVLFTSESVTEGHPDKVCDQVSDAVLDAMLAGDPNSHVACETVTTTGMVLVMGEISGNTQLDVPEIVRKTVCDIGYDGRGGFDGNTCAVLVALDKQSGDIAMGVNAAVEHKAGTNDAYDLIGAGDQGMVFGYACDETAELMPAAISYAHRMAQQLAAVRKSGKLPFLRPDGKSQVSVAYDENGRPDYIDTVLISTQHSEDVSLETLREAVIEEVIKPIMPQELVKKDVKFFVNPTGRFVVGGPQGDSGLTGRKLTVDTYGGYCRHGGGAFSGKDPTKVDRSAAYMARYVAKNLVAAGLCRRCELQIAYAIGVAQPVSVTANSFGTGVVSDARLTEIVREYFDLRPAAMIEHLDLRRPIYRPTAAYGHFGRPELALPWEKIDMADTLRGLR